MTPTEPDAGDRASLAEGLGRALRQPWKLTQAATLATDAFAERYAASHGLQYQAKGETPRHTWFLTKLYAPKSHSFMRGPLGGGADGLVFYASAPFGGGSSKGFRAYTVALFELSRMTGLGDGLACVPHFTPALGGHIRFGDNLPTDLTRAPIDGGAFDSDHAVGTTGAVDPDRLKSLFSADFIAWLQTLGPNEKQMPQFEIRQRGLCVHTWQTYNTTEELDAFTDRATRILEQVARATAT